MKLPIKCRVIDISPRSDNEIKNTKWLQSDVYCNLNFKAQQVTTISPQRIESIMCQPTDSDTAKESIGSGIHASNKILDCM